MPTHRRWTENDIAPDRRISWRQLLTDQAGMVSVDQLRIHGVSRHDINANVTANRWIRVLPRVYATFTGPLSRPARLHAALLYGSGYAILSHHTAAEEWGMIPCEDRPVEITVPYQCSAVSQLPLVRVHRSRALAHSTLNVFPPRTRRTDTILDLAVAQPTWRQARNLVVDLVSRCKVSAPEMLHCVEMRPPLRWRSTIKHALYLVQEGLMSALEVDYVETVEKAHGLPDGRRQTPFVVDGKTLYEDFTYDHVGVPLTVRLDGRRDHATAHIAFRDMRRDNAAELAGRARLTYGWHDVHRDPCAVAAQVRDVLVRGGWGPGEPRCRECAGRLEPAATLTTP